MSQPITIAVQLIMMVICCTLHSSNGWIAFGGLTQWTGLLAKRIFSQKDLTLSSLIPAPRQWTHSHVTGQRTIIGGFPNTLGYQICSKPDTLIVHQWLSLPYLALLFPDGADPADFVVQYYELPSSKELILPGQSENSLFKGLPNTPVSALRLDFSVINKARKINK